MDTLFLTLLLMSGLCVILAILAACELIWTRIAESKWWREMPPGGLIFDMMTILGIIVPGAFTGLGIFCIHATLGWTGVAAAAALFGLNFWIMRWLQDHDPEPAPMATRKEELA